MKKLNQKGFSLVELMVVVAIIGILAAIAVPNVNKFMLKSRQAEAKTNLASIYTADKAFQTEYSSFTTDFGQMGFAPEGELRYNTGFLTPAPFAGVGKNDMDHTLEYCDSALPNKGCTNYSSGASKPQALVQASTAAAATFNAASEAPFNAYGGTGVDSWQIDQTKKLTSTTNGI